MRVRLRPSRRPVRPLRPAWALAALLAIVPAAHGAPPDPAVLHHAPPGRFGTLPTPHTAHGLRNAVVDPADLGTHDYQVHASETVGIAYTCRAGFLDLDHVRDAADWTAFLHARFLDALREGRDTVRFDGEDRGVAFTVRLRVLPGDERARLAPPLAVALARRHAFLLLTWHEVLTWYGYREVFLFPEKVSAFSYEDTASHLVGLQVAGRALADDAPWDVAVDRALSATLRELGAVPRDGTWAAFDRVAGRWFDPGSAWPLSRYVRRRDLDVGLDGQGVTPWRVDGVPGCEGSTAATLVVDDLATHEGGRHADVASTRFSPGPASFWARLFPQGRPQADGRPVDAIDPDTQLADVMARLRRDVRAELGPDADQP